MGQEKKGGVRNTWDYMQLFILFNFLRLIYFYVDGCFEYVYVSELRPCLVAVEETTESPDTVVSDGY